VDALDRVAEAATDLLTRVDRTIGEEGAVADHAVWPLLRRLRSLPGDAVEAVATLRPDTLAGAGAVLDPLAGAYADSGRTAGKGQAWTGATATRFSATAGALATHLSGGGDTDRPGLAGRARATGRFADEVAGWMSDTRSAVARSVAAALGSAQAVTLRTTPAGTPETAAAAADIAATILRTIAEAYDAAETLSRQWAERLAEEDYRPPADEGPTGAGGFTVPGAG
jgi:hypothetical protein